MSDSTPKSLGTEEKLEYVPALANNGSSAYFYRGDEDRLVYNYVTDRESIYRIYSRLDGTLLFEIKLPRYVDDEAYITRCVADRWFVIKRYVIDGFEFEASKHYQAVYIYDIEKGILTLAEDYAEEPSLSPNGKLLLYTAPYGDSSYSHLCGWDKAEIGIYIKNLENGKTVFYPHESIGEYDYHSGTVEFISWVERSVFEELVK